MDSPTILLTPEIRSGILHHKEQRNNRTRSLSIVPRAFHWLVINHVHESLMHLGCNEHYWFEDMAKYVHKFVDGCITCKVSKSHSGRVQANLHPIPKISGPWHTVHVNITGKLSGKNDAKEYVIVLIHAFTKFVLITLLSASILLIECILVWSSDLSNFRPRSMLCQKIFQRYLFISWYFFTLDR